MSCLDKRKNQGLPCAGQDPKTAAEYLVSPVTVFPDLVKNDLDNRAVKTNLTIPAWLKEMAEAQDVNYSKIFQAALMDYLGVSQPPTPDHEQK